MFIFALEFHFGFWFSFQCDSELEFETSAEFASLTNSNYEIVANAKMAKDQMNFHENAKHFKTKKTHKKTTVKIQFFFINQFTSCWGNSIILLNNYVYPWEQSIERRRTQIRTRKNFFNIVIAVIHQTLSNVQIAHESWKYVKYFLHFILDTLCILLDDKEFCNLTKIWNCFTFSHLNE